MPASTATLLLPSPARLGGLVLDDPVARALGRGRSSPACTSYLPLPPASKL